MEAAYPPQAGHGMSNDGWDKIHEGSSVIITATECRLLKALSDQRARDIDKAIQEDLMNHLVKSFNISVNETIQRYKHEPIVTTK